MKRACRIGLLLAANGLLYPADDLARIDEIAPKGAAVGLRYPGPGVRTINR